MTCEGQRTTQLCQFRELALQRLIILFNIGIQLRITFLLGTIDAHGERLKMT